MSGSTSSVDVLLDDGVPSGDDDPNFKSSMSSSGGPFAPDADRNGDVDVGEEETVGNSGG